MPPGGQKRKKKKSSRTVKVYAFYLIHNYKISQNKKQNAKKNSPYENSLECFTYTW